MIIYIYITRENLKKKTKMMVKHPMCFHLPGMSSCIFWKVHVSKNSFKNQRLTNHSSQKLIPGFHTRNSDGALLYDDCTKTHEKFYESCLFE